MDVALAIERLVPAAEYRGSVTENTPEQYHALDWVDDRAKPTWPEIEAADRDNQRPTARDVDSERDRRISAGVTFDGHLYQSDELSRSLINDAYQLAEDALVEGALPGNTRWYSLEADFAWRTADNQWITMDAMTTVAFGKRIKKHRGDCIRAAIALKAMTPIPEDYADDRHWPD